MVCPIEMVLCVASFIQCRNSNPAFSGFVSERCRVNGLTFGGANSSSCCHCHWFFCFTMCVVYFAESLASICRMGVWSDSQLCRCVWRSRCCASTEWVDSGANTTNTVEAPHRWTNQYTWETGGSCHQQPTSPKKECFGLKRQWYIPETGYLW